MKERSFNIGDNIKKFRELKNITRDQMAADLNLSLSGYSKIERNEVDLTISRIQKIAQIIGVHTSQILNFDISHIFNLSNSSLLQGIRANTDVMQVYEDNYREKYIKMLEADYIRLKKLAGEV